MSSVTLAPAAALPQVSFDLPFRYMADAVRDGDGDLLFNLSPDGLRALADAVADLSSEGDLLLPALAA